MTRCGLESNYELHLESLKMKAAGSSETLVTTYHTTLGRKPDYYKVCVAFHRHENRKYHMKYIKWNRNL
jgi:hypothetical protein